MNKIDFIVQLQTITSQYKPLLDDLKRRTSSNKGLPFSCIKKIIKVLKILSESSLENSIEFEIFCKYLFMAYIAYYGNVRETVPQKCFSYSIDFF